MRGRRAAMVERLGGAPGWFVVASAVLAVLWFPARLFLDGDDPVVTVIARSGLYGAVWAMMLPVIEWCDRNVTRRRIRRANDHETSATPGHVRRGALVGLAVGVPFYGGLLVFCLITGRSWSYTAIYGVILVAVVAVAVARLQRSRP
ncbi:hypothetical protein Q0Z83_027460 [Actinoplanes sichuanensis]|nr:hypothetical protein Q0Z83_027460 [Actinoplanes sichuanensis]